MDFTERTVIDTSELVNLYASGLSLERIAQRVPMTAGGIRARLIKVGVVMRPKGVAMNPINKKPVATILLIERYQRGESAHIIGRSVGLAAKTVLDRLRRAGIARRKRSDYGGAFGALNPNWRGGRWFNGSGYVLVSSGTGARAVFEHRRVMEQVLRRPLKRHEHVHHINGIRDDNRPENLAAVDSNKHESRTFTRALQRRILYLETLLSEHGIVSK